MRVGEDASVFWDHPERCPHHWHGGRRGSRLRTPARKLGRKDSELCLESETHTLVYGLTQGPPWKLPENTRGGMDVGFEMVSRCGEGCAVTPHWCSLSKMEIMPSAPSTWYYCGDQRERFLKGLVKLRL